MRLDFHPKSKNPSQHGGNHQPPQAEQDQIATSMVVGTVNLPLSLLSEEQTLLAAAAAAIAAGSRRPQTAATKAGRDDTSQT